MPVHCYRSTKGAGLPAFFINFSFPEFPAVPPSSKSTFQQALNSSAFCNGSQLPARHGPRPNRGASVLHQLSQHGLCRADFPYLRRPSSRRSRQQPQLVWAHSGWKWFSTYHSVQSNIVAFCLASVCFTYSVIISCHQFRARIVPNAFDFEALNL
jgi:hypothetical protein